MTRHFLDRDGRPLTIVRGSARSDRYFVHDMQGDPKDLTGAPECSFLVAAHASATVADLRLTLGDGVQHTGTGGVVVVEITTAQTEALPLGKRWAELHLTDSQGRRDVISGHVDIVDSLATVP